MAIKINSAEKVTYVTFILDKSGSMESIRLPMISAFNEQLDSLRRNKVGTVKVSLVQFNDQINEIFMDIPIENISGKLDTSQYVTDGTTALCDAIGKTLLSLQKVELTQDTAHLVIIISDGLENSSRRFSKSQIKGQIEELESTGYWTFQYVGCEANALNEAKEDLKVRTFRFNKSAEGVGKLSSSLNDANAMYFAARATGATTVPNYLQDN